MNKVLATIGNETVTLSEYQEFIKGFGYGEQKDGIDETVLKRLLEERVILYEAKKKGIEINDTEVEKMIEQFKEQNGLTQEDFEDLLEEEELSIENFENLMRNKIIVSGLISEDVESKVVILDKDIKVYYDTHREDFVSSPATVEIKSIFLRLNQRASANEITNLNQITNLKLKALKIAEQLKEGESFDILVKEYSDEPLRSLRGFLGKFPPGALVPPLDKKAFSMKVDEISEPVWVDNGVYIMQIIDKHDERFKPIEEVKEEIYRRLYEERREKLLNVWIKTLWEKASVIINTN